MNNMKSKSLYLLSVIIISLIFFFFYQSNDYQQDELPNDISTQSTPKRIIKSSEVVTNDLNKNYSDPSEIEEKRTFVKESETTKECIFQFELDKDPRMHIVKDWLSTNLLMGSNNDITFYRNANEGELLQAAENGDNVAMWALGMNYRWQSMHDNFTSVYLRPLHQEARKYKTRPFDKEMMNLSRYWFNKAALNGLVASIGEAAMTYTLEINYLNKTEPANSNKLEELKMYRQAYLELNEWIAPELITLYGKESENPYFQYVPNSEESTIKYKKILFDLKSKWETERSDLWLSSQIDLQIPQEVIELTALSKNICGN